MDDTERKQPAYPSGGVDAAINHDTASGASDNRDVSADDRPADTSAGDGPAHAAKRPREYGGRKGPEPTRYGDWEKNGRCIDF